MGYNAIYLEKLCDTLGKSYGIYCAKNIGYFIGYVKQKLWDILGKTMGYIGQKLWDILWDILIKYCWIYLAKLWDIRVHLIY